MKPNRYDNLGDRMKLYESQTTKTTLIPNLPVYCRIDGRAFHTFCRGLTKPFCFELVDVMQEVCRFLVEETNAKLGYVQSDEISLCWEDMSKAPFDGKLFKLESILASLATARFNNYAQNFEILKDKCLKQNPVFDCRVFQVPNMTELANCFIWREQDAVRNSIQMLAQANFSHKFLQGKKTNELQNLLLLRCDIDWNDLRDDLKRGAYFKRVLVQKELDDEVWNKIPDDKKPESRFITRSTVVKLELPIMSKISNKVDVYFSGAEPEREEEC